jgi:acyl-CoA thioesterase II
MGVKELLGLERIDEETFRFTATDRLVTPGRFLFGGCALACGVLAMEEVTSRPTIYAAAHYLSYAMEGEEVTVKVTVAAQGNRISQARATAYAHDQEVLTVNAALGTGTIAAPEPWVTMINVPPPEECPPRVIPEHFGSTIFSFVETRIALQRPLEDLDGTPGSPISAMWVRLPERVDPSAATLAIFGDFLAGGASQAMGRHTMTRSLDNTIRVANLVDTDWVLCEMQMHALANGFSQGAVFLWSQDGVLLGTGSQSMSAKFFESPAT